MRANVFFVLLIACSIVEGTIPVRDSASSQDGTDPASIVLTGAAPILNKPSTYCYGYNADVIYQTLSMKTRLPVLYVISSCPISEHACYLHREGWNEKRGCRYQAPAALNITSIRCPLFTNNEGSPAERFEVMVTAVSEEGNITSTTTLSFFEECDRVFFPPPSNVSVQSVQSRQIVVNWRAPENLKGYSNMKYFLDFQAKGELQRKDPIITDSLSAVIPALVPDTVYDIFICAGDHNEPSDDHTSERVQLTVRTAEERPSKPPEILYNQITIKTEKNQDIRDVKLPWKIPEPSSWGGNLTRILLSYKSENGAENFINISDIWSGQFTLQGLQRRKKYTITLRLCNRLGCSVQASSYTLNEAFEEDAGQGGTLTTQTVVIICIVSIVLVSILVGTIVQYFRVRSRGGVIAAMPEITPDAIENPYDDVMSNESSSYYHVDDEEEVIIKTR